MINEQRISVKVQMSEISIIPKSNKPFSPFVWIKVMICFRSINNKKWKRCYLSIYRTNVVKFPETDYRYPYLK